jgi:hypothetical protein
MLAEVSADLSALQGDRAIQKLVQHIYLDHPVKPDDDLEKLPDDDPL